MLKLRHTVQHSKQFLTNLTVMSASLNNSGQPLDLVTVRNVAPSIPLSYFYNVCINTCDCSAVQSAVLRKCLATASVFLWRVTRHFVFVHMWFDICAVIAVIVVHRMFAVLSNGLNGKISSRSIVRNIFRFIFHPSFQD